MIALRSPPLPLMPSPRPAAAAAPFSRASLCTLIRNAGSARIPEANARPPSLSTARTPPRRPQGLTVEVQVMEEGQESPSWWEATLKQLKGEFAKVSFKAGNYPDDVVELDKIRASTPDVKASAKRLFAKQTVQLVDAKQHAWFLENETRITADVRKKAGLLSMVIDPRRTTVKLIGVDKSLKVAKMLLELHMKHQGDMQRVHNEREQLATKLQSEREKLLTGVRVEFPVPRSLIGLVIGKGGKNLVDTQKATGVDRVEVDPQGPRVIVVGPTQESVDAAREALEFVEDRVSVQPEQVGWLIGRSGRNFKELQEKTKVTRLNVDKGSNQVVLVGTKTAVEAARLVSPRAFPWAPSNGKTPFAAPLACRRRPATAAGVPTPSAPPPAPSAVHGHAPAVPLRVQRRDV